MRSFSVSVSETNEEDEEKVLVKLRKKYRSKSTNDEQIETLQD